MKLFLLVAAIIFSLRPSASFAEEILIYKAEAIRIAKVQFATRHGAPKGAALAVLATMKEGNIFPVEPNPRVAFSSIKDGDTQKMDEWKSQLEGRKFWMVTVRGNDR